MKSNTKCVVEEGYTYGSCTITMVTLARYCFVLFCLFAAPYTMYVAGRVLLTLFDLSTVGAAEVVADVMVVSACPEAPL